MKQNFSKLVDYIKLLNSLKPASTLRSGYFYCYKYYFYKHYPKEELKFYDYYPLIFCFSVYKAKKEYFYGLNFHHMPVAARRYWMSKFKRIASAYFKKGGYTRIPAIDYGALLKIMKKAKFGVRLYRFEAVRDLRQVSLDELNYLMKWYARTYYGVTIKQVQAKYNNFKP
jgi:hypothetical protein